MERFIKVISIIFGVSLFVFCACIILKNHLNDSSSKTSCSCCDSCSSNDEITQSTGLLWF